MVYDALCLRVYHSEVGVRLQFTPYDEYTEMRSWFRSSSLQFFSSWAKAENSFENNFDCLTGAQGLPSALTEKCCPQRKYNLACRALLLILLSWTSAWRAKVAFWNLLPLQVQLHFKDKAP